MDCDRAIAARLDRRDGIRTAVRRRYRLAAGPQGFLGKDLARRDHLSAAGTAAGRDRLPVAYFVRPPRTDRRFLADHLGLVFSFRWTGAALACGVMGFPLMVRPIRLALEAIDRRLEDAAATLGANRLWVFFTITLPLALPGIIAGAVMCFARALGEFGATITFVSNIPGETQTISAAIYTLLQVPGGEAMAGRLVLVAIALSLAALIISEWFARRAGMRFQGE